MVVKKMKNFYITSVHKSNVVGQLDKYFEINMFRIFMEVNEGITSITNKEIMK